MQAPQPMTDPKYGTAEEIMKLGAPKLVALLADAQATPYAKAKACHRLATVGDKNAVPALAALLTDPQLSHPARAALEQIPDASATTALRAALAKVKGRLLVGVITSVGARRDHQAIDALAALLSDPDAAVARAANEALARVRPSR